MHGCLFSQKSQCLWVAVEGDDFPARSEQGKAIAPGSTAQIQCLTRFTRPAGKGFVKARVRRCATGCLQKVVHQNGAGDSKRIRSPVCG